MFHTDSEDSIDRTVNSTAPTEHLTSTEHGSLASQPGHASPAPTTVHISASDIATITAQVTAQVLQALRSQPSGSPSPASRGGSLFSPITPTTNHNMSTSTLFTAGDVAEVIQLFTQKTCSPTELTDAQLSRVLERDSSVSDLRIDSLHDLHPKTLFRKLKRYVQYRSRTGLRFLRDFVSVAVTDSLGQFFFAYARSLGLALPSEHFLNLAPDEDLLMALRCYCITNYRLDLVPGKLLDIRMQSLTGTYTLADVHQHFTNWTELLDTYSDLLRHMGPTKTFDTFLLSLPDGLAKHLKSTLQFSTYDQAHDYAFRTMAQDWPTIYSLLPAKPSGGGGAPPPTGNGNGNGGGGSSRNVWPTSAHASKIQFYPIPDKTKLSADRVKTIEERHKLKVFGLPENHKKKYPYKPRNCMNCNSPSHAIEDCPELCRFCDRTHHILEYRLAHSKMCDGWHRYKWPNMLAFECSLSSLVPPPTTFILDTAARPIYLNDLTHLDPPSLSSGTRSSSHQLDFLVADGHTCTSDAVGTFSGRPAIVDESFPTNLLPLQDLIQSDKSAVFVHDSVYLLPSAATSAILDVIDNNQPLWTSTSPTGIHEVAISMARQLLSPSPSSVDAIAVDTSLSHRHPDTLSTSEIDFYLDQYQKAHSDILYSSDASHSLDGDTDAADDHSTFLAPLWAQFPGPKSLHIPSSHSAFASFYKTARLGTLAEAVLFLHEILGHCDLDTAINSVEKDLIDGLPSGLTPAIIRKYWPTCAACPIGSLSQKPIPRTPSATVYAPGEKLFIDIKYWAGEGSYPRTFRNGAYTVTLIDSATDYVVGKVISSRRHLLLFIASTVADFHRQGRIVKIIQADNEYTRLTSLRDFCRDQNISLRSGIPYEHFHQGKVERLHRTMEDAVAKCFANKPHLPRSLWGYAYLHWLDLHNHLPTSKDPDRTPALRFCGTRLNLHHTPLFPFGTSVIAHIPLEQQSASTGRGFPTFFVGRAIGYDDALLLYNPVTTRVIARRTYKVLGPTPIEPLLTTVYHPSLLLAPDELPSVSADYGFDLSPPPVDTLAESAFDVDTCDDVALDMPLSADTTPADEYSSLPFSAVHHSQRRYYEYIGKTFFDRDDDTYFLITGIFTRTSDTKRILYFQFHATSVSVPTYDDYEYQPCSEVLHAEYIYWAEDSSDPSQALLTTATSSKLPSNYSQALHHPTDSAQFLAATDVEIDRWRELGVPGPLDVPLASIPSKDIGQLRTLYTIKRHADGSYHKHKLRVYYDGSRWSQYYSSDTYAGVARRESQRLLLTLAAIYDLDLWSFDISTFFLYAQVPPDKRVYARRPPGFPDSLLPPVMRLNSYVYGHPEANAAATKLLCDFLVGLGFRPTVSDPLVYILHTFGHPDFCAISTHVDDGTVISQPGSSIRSWLKTQLQARFDITSEDDLSSLLGMSLTRDRANHIIDLHPTKTLDDLFLTFPEALCDPSTAPSTPLTPKTEWTKRHFDLEGILLNSSEASEFQQLVGLCNWLSTCRYDILFAVNHLSRSLNKPTRLDRFLGTQLLRYIYNTRDLTLRFGGPDATLVHFATADSSYSSHPDRKSHTGGTFHISTQGAPYDVLTKKQSVTADSSTVSETIGCHYISKGVKWARTLLSEFGITLDPTTLFSDNKSTLRIISNSGSSGASKHIDIRYMVLREYIANKEVSMQYLPTHDMLADFFTKALPPHQFLFLRNIIMGHSPYPTTISVAYPSV